MLNISRREVQSEDEGTNGCTDKSAVKDTVENVEDAVTEKATSETKERIVIPSRKFAIEFYVGLFTILGVLAFAYLAVNMARMKISSSAYYNVTAKFDNVAGLQEGATVEIAGVQIGQVKSIVLDSTSALITMEVLNNVKLRDDDIVSVRTKGIIGDRYIKISPGGSDKNVGPGGSLSDTESAVELEDVIGKMIHRME